MPREISDEEYAFLQGRRQVADFIEPIWNDPQLSNEAKALVKKKYPNMEIPGYDVEQRVTRLFADEKKKRDDDDKKTAREKQEAAWKEERAKTQKAYGFTDEAMKELEQFMIDNNVASYEVAAGYKAAKAPRASEPTPTHGMPWDHSKSETFREIAKDPEAWGRGEIMKALKTDQDRARQAY
jgi:hypothetical protein